MITAPMRCGTRRSVITSGGVISTRDRSGTPQSARRSGARITRPFSRASRPDRKAGPITLPEDDRSNRLTPSWPSSFAIRLDTACCVSPAPPPHEPGVPVRQLFAEIEALGPVARAYLRDLTDELTEQLGCRHLRRPGGSARPTGRRLLRQLRQLALHQLIVLRGVRGGPLRVPAAGHHEYTGQERDLSHQTHPPPALPLHR